jgi:hypothetical protein
MTPDEYLNDVLMEQGFEQDDPELQTLRRRAGEVKDLLRSELSAHSPSVHDAGSHKKKTMIRASYDFDILVYFDHDTEVGGTLKEIRDEVKRVLDEKYAAEPRRSALRILDASEPEDPEYFHIDVVPGRFMDGNDGDVAIYQEGGEKGWLKTNPEIHIQHIRESGVRDAIKLLKLWNHDRSMALPTFVLELLTVKLLDGKAGDTLSEQLTHVWTEFRDRADSLCVEDPANSNNDLTDALDDGAKMQLAVDAQAALDHIEADEWEAILGEVKEQSKGEMKKALETAPAVITSPSVPYLDGEQ